MHLDRDLVIKFVAHLAEVDDLDDCMTFCPSMFAVRERVEQISLLIDSHLVNSLSVGGIQFLEKVGHKDHRNALLLVFDLVKSLLLAHDFVLYSC